MRYFIFYPPSNTLKQIDVNETDRAESILEIVKQEFGLKLDESVPSSTSMVLSYNGFDLKPKWTFADLNIPSGAIIRCITKAQTKAELYIHCGFNKQLLKLFEPTITIETTIGTIRKHISNKLGLPLSTFCLETLDGKTRLYDEMKLMSYDINIHDYVYLKVWHGYEKFINACVKGFKEPCSPDDMIRHYQAQVALYIAAFHGHMDLARHFLNQGARSDRPVPEHPSRQWSSETSTNTLPEMLKCPIHIAIEQGHMKIVDLFVRHSILCTQTREPITNLLPYELAYSYVLRAKAKEEQQRYNEIYFFLKDKQFNLRIPITAPPNYVTDLLKSTSKARTMLVVTTFYVRISLATYCKIINWCERARERAWKNHGGRFATMETKRVYPETGLLGYKVLIDGYNNKFEVPPEQLRSVRHHGALHLEHPEIYAGFTDEEREKILHLKASMKQSVLDERRRAKQAAASHLQQSRRQPKLLPQTSMDTTKHPMTRTHTFEAISTSSDFSSSQLLSSTTGSDLKHMRSIHENDNSSVTTYTTLQNAAPIQNSHHAKEKNNTQRSKSQQPLPYTPPAEGEKKHKFPILVSTVTNYASTNKLEAMANSNKPIFQPMMSTTDAYLGTSSFLNVDNQHNKSELAKTTERSRHGHQHHKETTPSSLNGHSNSKSVERGSVLDLDYHVPLPEHSTSSHSNPIRSRIDLAIHQSTINSYERYASASTRSTAIDCLQEAAFFKKKPWIKKVEISKEMIKNKVQQRIRRAADEATKAPLLSPMGPALARISKQSDIVKVN